MTHKIEDHAMKISDVQSQPAYSFIEVQEGETFRLDASTGALSATRIINNGTIEIFSSRNDVADACIEVAELSGCGTIVCLVPEFRLRTTLLECFGGTFEAEIISMESDADLFVKGGTFKSKHAHFKAAGELDVHADRVDGEVSVCAEKVSFGVASGDLDVVKSEIFGDPIWYNRAGNLSITPGATNGEDLYAFATGNVTVGTIDTTGGDSNHPGRIVIESGCVSITPDGSAPTNSTVQTACVDCDSVRASLNVVSAAEPTGIVTINGNISGKNLSIRAEQVDINGDISIDADNNTEGGNAQIDFKTALSIDGNVSVVGTSGRGKLALSGTQSQTTDAQNVTVTGSIDADVLIVTINTGTTEVDDIDSDSIEIYSGGAVTLGGTLDVSGAGSAAGGSITVSAAGAVDLTSAQLVANGGTTGDGGAINFSSGSGNLTIASGLFSASAGQGSGSNASGGRISVTGAANVTLGTDLNVDGVGTGAGGSIELRAGGTLNLSTHTLSSEGGGTGDGGSISLFSASNFSLDPTKVNVAGGQGSGSDASGGGISAESSGNLTLSSSVAVNGVGAGSGGAVSLTAGATLSLGSSTITCDGGSTGNGGYVRLASGVNFTFDPTKVSVDAGTGSGSDASGGSIEVNGAANLTLSGNVAVDGVGEGAGGRVSLSAAGVLSIGSNTISANGGDTGDGGYVSLISNDDISLASGQVSVSAGQDSASDGTGGTLQVVSATDVTIGAAIHLDGMGDGWGGNLLLSAGGTLGISTHSLSANGGDTGGGGSVKLLSGSALSIASGQLAASAGTGSGNNADGGTIEVNGTADVTVSGALSVNGIGTGAGGRIAIDSGATLSVGSNNFSAQGGTTGNGGFIHLGSANDLTLAASQFSVSAGSGSGSNAAGGTIELTTSADLTIAGTLSANGVGTGAGGSILVNAGVLLDMTSAVLQANGGTLGHGGAVSISSGAGQVAGPLEETEILGSQVSVLSGAGSGANTNGGFITVKATGNQQLALLGDFNLDSHGSGSGGTMDAGANSTLFVSQANIHANSLNGDANTSAGRIVLSGSPLVGSFNTFLLAQGLLDAGLGGAKGGQIELNHYGTEPAEIFSLILASGSAGGAISIKAVDGPIEFQGTAQAATPGKLLVSGSITVESPESITLGPTAAAGFSLEAGGVCTLGAPVINNKGIIRGNSVNLLSGSQLSLDLTNELIVETLPRGSNPFGELKIGSDRNNLPYKMTISGKVGDSARFFGNPITVQSAGDLTVNNRLEFYSSPTGLPTLIAAGKTYTLNVNAASSILAFNLDNAEEPIDLKVSAERILCQAGATIGARGKVDISSETRLIADLSYVTCDQLSLSGEDVRAVAWLNLDAALPVTCKVSGEARSGDWSLKADYGDISISNITAANSVEVDSRRGRITNAVDASVVASNGSVSIIQGGIRKGVLTLSDIDIEAVNGDVNIVVDRPPTAAPDLDEGTQPSGDVTVVPSNGNVFWGQQGITIAESGNVITVPTGTEADPKVVFYTYGKGSGSIVLNGDVNITVSGCPCDLPVDIGNIYYGDGDDVVGLSPGAEGQILTTHGADAPSWGDGMPGPQGPAGATGATGAAGATGATGATGPKGPLGFNWRGEWSGSTSYLVDDEVSFNGSIYVAIVNNSSSQPPSSNWNLLASKGDTGAAGAAGAQGPTGATGNTGAQGPDGIVWRGAWSSATAYSVDDAVVLNGTSYIATNANTNSQPPSANWSTLAQKGDAGIAGAAGATGSTGPDGPQGSTGATGAKGPKGLVWRGAWNSSTSYVVDDAVTLNGTSYIAIANNSNDSPPSANWQVVSAKGDTGAGGATGATGATGAAGATGAQGPQGPQGPAGPDGAAGRKSVIKTSDTTRISTTTLADDPHLSLALEANKTYHFCALFTLDMEVSGPHFKMAFVGPTGSTISWTGLVKTDFLSGTGGTSQAANSVDGGINNAICYGSIAVGNTAGNLTLQWAQNTSQNRDVTLKSTGLLMATPV